MGLKIAAAACCLVAYAVSASAPPPELLPRKEVELILGDPLSPYVDPATAPIIETPDHRVWMTPEQRQAINDLLIRATILIEKQNKEIERLRNSTGCS